MRHGVLVVALAAGVVLRLLAHAAGAPSGVGGAVAHLAGPAAAVAAYALVLRWGVAPWLAALAVLPVLVDADQVAAEHAAVPATYLAALLAVCLLVLGWGRGAGVVTAAVGVALAGVAAVVGTGPATSARVELLSAWVPTVPDVVPLAGLVLALLAAAGLGRAARSGLRAPSLLVAAVAAAVLVVDQATGGPAALDSPVALALLPAAGALGLTALLRGRRSSGRRPDPDETDVAALARFRDDHGTPALAPVVVVVAAYNEAAGLPEVLSRLPHQACGLPLDVVVVDDGSSDGTAAAVAAHGRAYAVACPANRGQGAALRLGYRVARTYGARYVMTTDADGQYDAGEIADVLAPVVAGRADFVTGSRRLGRQHTQDRVRHVGVHVFAWVVSALTGVWLTDTSFGLRAMRADVTGDVTLDQPQYQSSELLIGVLSRGYRVLEVPGTMHLRTAGSSKKGGNLVYGTRYARVVLGTWWREGCPAPARESAPALAPVRQGRRVQGAGAAAP